MTLGSAFVVAFAGKIVHNVFALLFTFFGVAGLYVLLSADFLAGAQVLVYVGGILVLLLFGVMLTQRIQGVELKRVTVQTRAGRLVCVVLLGVLLAAIYLTRWPIREQAIEQTTAELGRHLMTDFVLPFELISILLLEVLVAAAMMARREVRR